MRRSVITIAAVVPVLVLACTARDAALAAEAPARLASGTARVRAVLINGGGRPARNYQSHFLHIQELVRLLRERGVPKDDIVVFASDGASPTPDLAVRDREPEADFWLISDVWPGTLLGNRVRYENSTLDGVTIRPAKKEALRRFFAGEAERLTRGDLLFIYVTDHGTKNDADLANNRIVLWGEELSVRELREMLAPLDPSVRVITLMSQCFSGSFAHLMADGETAPDGNVCGYFSATPDRFAYGCYPENRGKENVGHSFRFIDALESLGSFSEAHEMVLLTDRTPDVPHRTSDVYAEQQLDREAARRGMAREALVDELLEDAWRDTRRFHREIELLDRMAETWGFGRPQSLGELDVRTREVRGLLRRLQTYTRRWKDALTDFKRAHIDRFTDANPVWRERLAPDLMKGIDSRKKRMLSQYFLEGLIEFIEGDRAILSRLKEIKSKYDSAAAARYRMEVRLGGLLRMETMLTRIAGLVYFEHYGAGRERVAFDRVVACEDVDVNEGKRKISSGELPTPEPFPDFAADTRLVDGVEPGWLGIGFRQVDRGLQRELELLPGAVKVLTVHTASPAERGGIEVGDIVLGPPGDYFDDPFEVRRWSMLSPAGSVRRLELLRDGQPIAVEVTMGGVPTS